MNQLGTFLFMWLVLWFDAETC